MEFATHMVLDVVGLIPVIGEPADLLNASIYLAEGNYLDASLSAAGAIPFAGWAASGAQIVKSTYRAANAAMEVADTVSDGIRLADNAPLSAATPPASTITTFDPVPPMVKMPEAPIALPKTPDVAPPLKQIEAAPVLKQIEAAPAAKLDDVATPAPLATGSARFEVSADGVATDLVGSHNSISIGHYPAYVLNAQSTGARTFSVSDEAWDAMSDAERWLRNKRFLDDAINRCSEIHLATPLSEVRPGSMLELEIEYLSSRGYVPNSAGTLMVPGGG